MYKQKNQNKLTGQDNLCPLNRIRVQWLPVSIPGLYLTVDNHHIWIRDCKAWYPTDVVTGP